MRPLALALTFAGLAAAQPVEFRIQPDPITDCVDGRGRAVLSWTVRTGGGVLVRIGSPDGDAMTGVEPPSGSATTGDWVDDGMVFVLVDATGRELARVAARVNCVSFAPSVLAALAAESYFPLRAGYRWTYRGYSRQVSSFYETRTITGTTLIAGETWYEMTFESPGATRTELYRTDEEGRVYRRIGVVEELYLDPTATPSGSAVLRITGRRRGIGTSIGRLPDAVDYTRSQALIQESGTFVRGVGFIGSTANVLAGSSGGFSNSLDLVEASLGALQFAAPSAALELGVESATIDVSSRRATNCAVPCYFVACGLVPGADPPGTYKPCAQVRVRSAGIGGAPVVLELRDATGRVLHSTTVSGGVAVRQAALYDESGVPFLPGVYRLVATAGEAASAALTVTLR